MDFSMQIYVVIFSIQGQSFFRFFSVSKKQNKKVTIFIFIFVFNRAKELFVVIGNITLLSRDDTWREFIQFCAENNLIV